MKKHLRQNRDPPGCRFRRGLAIATALAEAGASEVMADIPKDAVEEVANALSGADKCIMAVSEGSTRWSVRLPGAWRPILTFVGLADREAPRGEKGSNKDDIQLVRRARRGTHGHCYDCTSIPVARVVGCRG
jgi:hypothetical protein